MIGLTISRKHNIKDMLFFLLGLFSTMQIVTFLGFTVFLWLSYGTLIYLILTQRRFKLTDYEVIIYGAVVLLSMVVNFYMNTISEDYQKRSLTSVINLIVLIIVYVVGESNDCSRHFFRGFKLSCKIQLVWCIVQIVIQNTLNTDVNNLVFNQLLGMTENTTQVRNGIYVCSGLHWHAANMIPILIFLYVFSKKWVTKALCIFVTVQTHNTTAFLTVGFCCVMEIMIIFFKAIKNRRKKISKKQSVIGLGIIAGFMALSTKIVPYVIGFVGKILYRFIALTGNLKGGEGDVGVSSLVHLYYYTNLPEMLEQSNVVNVLIGYGMECSGYVYSKLYGQYEELVWIIESDIVNIMLNMGIIGFVLHYWLIVRILFIRNKKISYHYYLLIFAILLGGVTYGVQFSWVIFVELMLYSFVKKDNDMFYLKKKKENHHNE